MSIQLIALLTRHDSMDREQFEKYWLGHHAKVFMSNPAARKHVYRYTQTRLPHGKGLTELEAKVPGLQVPRHVDGLVNFWFESMEDLVAVFGSEYYQTVVVADEKKFIKHSQLTFLIGEDEVKWENGKQGKDVKADSQMVYDN